MIKPVYRIGEKSKMKIFKVIPRVSLLLVKLFFKRIWVKYLLRDFHPIFLFYNGGILLLVASISLLKIIVSNALVKGAITTSNLMLTFLLFVLLGSLFLFLAMWMDIQDNDRYINR
jgi:hypothetical protein